ncbi:MAG: hypothetical protein WKG07_33460 [Hymenobacter sp.]
MTNLRPQRHPAGHYWTASREQPRTDHSHQTRSMKAVYKNMVDILDEMNITNQRKYALVASCRKSTKTL